MTKVCCVMVSALIMAGLNTTAIAQTAQAPQIFVAGSDSMDFRIYCQKDGKMTMGIFNRNNVSEYQVARNVSYMPLGNGQYALHFMRGFTSSSLQPEVYFPAVGESCEVTKQ